MVVILILILTINNLLKQKSYDKVYLVKSSKNSSNKRFNSFTNSKIKIIVIPELKNMSSKDFCENIYKKKNISKYLPNGLSKKYLTLIISMNILKKEICTSFTK